MDKRLADLKSEIQAEFEVKRQELLKENSINDMAYSAQERVLNEIDVVKQRIQDLTSQKTHLEDEISETQYQRSKLEQKIHCEKQKRIQDSAKLETDLKNEFEKARIEHEQAQDQLHKIRKLFEQEKQAAANRTDNIENKESVEKGLNEIKDLVSDILKTTTKPNDNQFDENHISVQIDDLRKIVPNEMKKIAEKIHKL